MSRLNSQRVVGEGRAALDRLSPDDLMSIDGDAGTVPMQVGGILWLEPGRLRPDDVRAQFERRLPAAPRLRQVVRRVPVGCGRPVWMDDPDFELGNHLQTAPVADDGELGHLATGLLVHALPGGRPPWAARLALAPDGTVRAVVLVLHHVLADGLAALAMLTALTDGPEVPNRRFPLPLPARAVLAADALRSRWRGLRRLPSAAAEVVMALRMLRGSGTVPATSLNRATGEARSFVSVTRGLAAVRAAAHGHGGTVNDAALAVVAGALRTVLVSRGEDPDRFVISVPFAYHAPGTATGNASAVMPLPVDARGPVGPRVAATAVVTREAKRHPRALGNAILRPGFRLMVRTGWFRRFIDNQRRVNTIVTNVRGPAERVSLAGCPVERIVPLTVVTGNLTLVFAVLSYAGQLSLTAMADTGSWPDLDAVRTALDAELDALLAG